MIRQRWVERANHDVMTYACPEANRVVLEAEDPLNAATLFVHRGKQLELWALDPIDPGTTTPRRLAGSLDSLRAAIAMIATSFQPAIATAASHERECDVLSRIDAGTMRGALKDYFRHGSALAEVFEDAGVSLRKLVSCREAW